MMNSEFDTLRTNPMTATTRDDGDVADPQNLSLAQLVRTLDEARHQFLEAKHRYLKLRELVRLRRIQERRGLQELEELARLSRLSQNQAQAQAQANHPEADVWSRLNQELNDNTLWLRTLKEVLLMRLTRLCRQQRAVRRRAGAQAVQQWRQTPEVRDQLAQLQTFKKMIKLREDLRLRQLCALSRQNDTAERRPDHHPIGNALCKKPLAPQPERAPIEEPIERQEVTQGPAGGPEIRNPILRGPPR